MTEFEHKESKVSKDSFRERMKKVEYKTMSHALKLELHS